jgi:hypothetical protein
MIFRHRLASVSKYVYMQSDSFTDVFQSLFARLSLADAARKTRHLCHNVTVFAGI